MQYIRKGIYVLQFSVWEKARCFSITNSIRFSEMRVSISGLSKGYPIQPHYESHVMPQIHFEEILVHGIGFCFIETLWDSPQFRDKSRKFRTPECDEQKWLVESLFLKILDVTSSYIGYLWLVVWYVFFKITICKFRNLQTKVLLRRLNTT